MAGASSYTRTFITAHDGVRVGERLVITWESDGSGDVDTLPIELRGFLAQIITNPGAADPTDDYDITLTHPNDSSLDVLGGALADRDTSISEIVAPVISGATLPVLCIGVYTMTWANVGNSKNGQVIIETLFP